MSDPIDLDTLREHLGRCCYGDQAVWQPTERALAELRAARKVVEAAEELEAALMLGDAIRIGRARSALRAALADYKASPK